MSMLHQHVGDMHCLRRYMEAVTADAGLRLGMGSTEIVFIMTEDRREMLNMLMWKKLTSTTTSDDLRDLL